MPKFARVSHTYIDTVGTRITYAMLYLHQDSTCILLCSKCKRNACHGKLRIPSLLLRGQLGIVPATLACLQTINFDKKAPYCSHRAMPHQINNKFNESRNKSVRSFISDCTRAMNTTDTQHVKPIIASKFMPRRASQCCSRSHASGTL